MLIIKIKQSFCKHDLAYYAECPEESCSDDYVGETARCISEKVIDHGGRDKNYHVLKHQSIVLLVSLFEVSILTLAIRCIDDELIILGS